MTLYQTAEASRSAGIAYHLSPEDVWESQKNNSTYLPEPFEQDGFIHTTNGTEKLLWVANEFYTEDERAYTVLVLDVSKLTSPLRYDDDGEVFPHIYGPLNTDAVIGELQVQRADDGRFVSFTQ